MASTKRELPQEQPQPDSKKAKLTVSESQSSQIKLNPADCDLDFDVETDGLRGKGLYEKGFAYCWSGARANIGINKGKYVFGCKIIAAQPVEMEDTPLDQQHVCRIGISRGDDAVGKLGETLHSFGYGGTGKFSCAGKFSDYGDKFGVGDTIVCAVNLDSKPMASVGFYKNGKWLGVAKEFDAGKNGLGVVVDTPSREREWECAIFPHILLKNVVVELQFGVEDGLVVEEGHEGWGCALEHGNAIMGPVFANTKDCEVLMMVGLPAAGKTTWAENWVKQHPEKRYLLLGTNLALDQMKVPGLLRKQNYGERFDRLMDRATGIFNTLLARAAKTPRNFILDQTNVYKGARKRKLKPFFQYRKIAVVVLPKPDVLKLRSEKRFKEMGKEVPAEAVNEMLANYVLPTSKDMSGSDEHFDQVWFAELSREDSQRCLEEMKRALQTTSSSPYSSKSSAQSFASPSLKKGTSGQHHLNPPEAGYGHPVPHQVKTSASSAGSQWQPQYVSGQYQSGSDRGSYGNYAMMDQNQRSVSESRSPIPQGTTGWHQNYGGVDSYDRPYSGSRNFLSEDGPPHYQSRGEVGSYYSGPDSERSSTYGSQFGSPRTPISYRNHGNPQFAPAVPRESAYSPYSDNSSNHGASLGRTASTHGYPGDSQYATQVPGQPAYHPGRPSPSSYGSPYGAPPPTSPYGDVRPRRQQQSEGYSNYPGPRYY